MHDIMVCSKVPWLNERSVSRQADKTLGAAERHAVALDMELVVNEATSAIRSLLTVRRRSERRPTGGGCCFSYLT